LRKQKAKELPATLDLSFASEQWRRLIVTRQNGKPMLIRKHLEVCIFTYLAAELKSGDVAVARSDSYADYREQLLPWIDCAPRVADYCGTLGLPDTAAAFVADLKDRLTQAAATFDRLFPENDQVRISEQGEPILKRIPRQEPSAAGLALEARLLGRLRNLRIHSTPMCACCLPMAPIWGRYRPPGTCAARSAPIRSRISIAGTPTSRS
jgi:hypothetical protein